MKTDLEILSTELLKPSTPTPHHLKFLKRSSLDQIALSTYVPVNLFYTNNSAQHDLNIPDILTHLKNSLSETLTHFYPFAGRLKDQVSIDCNDEGVLYKEARAGCRLLEILEKPDIAFLTMLVPRKPFIAEKKSPSLPLLGVQVNVFQCGGIGIGICFSHLIADAKSISTFLKSWANTARGFTDPKIIHPDFTAASTLFPPRDPFPDHGMTIPTGSEGGAKFLLKRFLLDEKSLGRLKTKVATNTNPNPTRIQALAALVWERYNFVISKVPLGVDTSNFPCIIQFVNFRPRADPPLPDCSIGNLFGMTVAQHELPTLKLAEDGSPERRLLLPDLAERVKKSFDSVDSQFICYLQSDQELLKSEFKVSAENLQPQETSSPSASITITSWCNMGFYQVDFGWGEPIWVATAAPVEEPNTILKYSGGGFYDARPGGGIEAWLILPEEQMVVLENDPEFLEFASLNPSVLNC